MANLNRNFKASGVGGFLKKKQRYEYGLPASEKEKLLTAVPEQTEAFSEIKAAPHREIHLPPANLNWSKIPLADCGINKVIASSDNVIQKKDNIKTNVPVLTPKEKIHNYSGDAREQLQKKIAEETEHEAKESATAAATDLKGSGLPQQQEPKRPLKLGIATFEEQLKNVPIHPAVDEKNTDQTPSTSSAKQSDTTNLESTNTEEKPEWLQKLWII